MPTSRFERFLPLAAVLAAVLFAVPEILMNGMPAVSDGPAETARWLDDHQARAFLAAVASGYFAVLMLFFATGLRQALRSGEPGESTYSTAAFAGGLLIAVSSVLTGALRMGAVEAAADGRTAVVTALGYADEFSWVPWAAGSGVLFLAAGLGGLRTAVLPRWLAYVTAALGVLSLTGPTGIGVYYATPLWLIGVGLLLHGRVTRGDRDARSSHAADTSLA
ncbi:hypothetical protein [Streptomyces boninensis]|uniref:hypothetical protein n=1 Tax=Streptomyces boninensis TaxID=2039455 RepID=UPI003B21D642